MAQFSCHFLSRIHTVLKGNLIFAYLVLRAIRHNVFENSYFEIPGNKSVRFEVFVFHITELMECETEPGYSITAKQGKHRSSFALNPRHFI